jgi:hypothetical protein
MEQQQQLTYQGVPVFLDGRDYIVPSLSVEQFKQHYELLKASPREDENSADFIANRIPIIGAALRRNYPEVTDAQLLEIVDLTTFNQLILAVQGASGMKPVKPGEGLPVVAK